MRLWRCSEEFQEPVYRGPVREVVFGEGGGGGGVFQIRVNWNAGKMKSLD